MQTEILGVDEALKAELNPDDRMFERFYSLYDAERWAEASTELHPVIVSLPFGYAVIFDKH